MENNSFRRAARVVGSFDLIVAIICAVVLIGALTYISLLPDVDYEKDYSFNIFLVIIRLVIALWILLSIFLSILLLRATKLTADPKTSLKRVKLWLVINIFLFVLGIIGGIIEVCPGEWISLVVLLCVRGPLIWLVQLYKRSLACHCVDHLSPPPPLPTSSL